MMLRLDKTVPHELYKSYNPYKPYGFYNPNKLYKSYESYEPYESHESYESYESYEPYEPCEPVRTLRTSRVRAILFPTSRTIAPRRGPYRGIIHCDLSSSPATSSVTSRTQHCSPRRSCTSVLDTPFAPYGNGMLDVREITFTQGHGWAVADGVVSTKQAEPMRSCERRTQIVNFHFVQSVYHNG